MNNYVIRANDLANFLPLFTGATVTVPSFPMVATSDLKAEGIPVCLDGDQALVIIPGCPYVRPPYIIPGTGIVTIKLLGVDQLSVNTTYRDRRIILLGSVFDALFIKVVPAFAPNPSGAPIPDPTPTYNGTGFFSTSNYKVKVS